ncbi:MAG: DUF2130 domain-containing protein [Chloroflexi bacterium]|nr:DUF2130 domain-containing protein [Chloroflexota bacterium]
MAEQSIICPHCNKKILLSKALTGQIEEKLRKSFDAELRSREKEIEKEFKEQLAAERRQAEKRAKESLAVELASLRQQVAEKDEAIEEARKHELDLRKQQRELEKKEKMLELEIARKIDEERRKVEEEVATRIAEENRAKDLEKEKQLSDLRKQIEDLKRKAEQGSQQTQGEAIEVELEDLLRANFPYDQIEPVGKGIKGADILQRVYTTTGQFCGTIIWESKNTKTWSDGWLEKLRDDQRTAKAEVAAIVTITLPKDVSHFACIEGVWVTDFSTVLGVASALRANLSQVAITKLAVEGKSDKMEMLYNYLSGTEFKQRVEAIVESFVSMKDDLEREKRAMESAWAKRDKQIYKVIHNVSGMYGDMQGIIGASLPKIDYLELPSPEDDSVESE